jgi:uncharacterized protein (DUF488 family)
MNLNGKTIWTVGHSTRPIEEFLQLLSTHAIELLVDIRSYPGSRRYPHFNKENLAATLREHGIQYNHMAGLGGRRKPSLQSLNSAWRNSAFRGYADYMQTAEFKASIVALQKLGENERTAYMCSEAPWWKCHRALVSDYLKVHGWLVLHIMEKGKLTEHPFTSPARMVQGELFYSGDEPRENEGL